MRKAKSDELRAEYQRDDLGPGVRGKYLKAYQSGTNLVLLRDDVADVFPDEDSVNEALRSLIKVARAASRRTGRSRRRAPVRP